MRGPDWPVNIWLDLYSNTVTAQGPIESKRVAPLLPLIPRSEGSDRYFFTVDGQEFQTSEERYTPLAVGDEIAVEYYPRTGLPAHQYRRIE